MYTLNPNPVLEIYIVSESRKKEPLFESPYIFFNSIMKSNKSVFSDCALFFAVFIICGYSKRNVE